MELLSPAGTLEKLEYAYAYGADAAYVGMQNFSLRSRAGNIDESQIEALKAIKGSKKLYGAVNSFFHEKDIGLLRSKLESIKAFPFDALIVSDMGAAALLRNYFGKAMPLHLSTQANCLNSEALKVYQDLGFSRIILAREVSLAEIKKLKQAVAGMEIETFVHGAMCMAYSGRCLLSAFLSGRSANAGDCAHTCRWNYRLALEEESRPGEYFPISEEGGFTTILSSKDLCMIDHLDKLREAGIDSLKIEGRMKSLYYVATVTRAYRKALDKATDWRLYRDELFRVSHREYSTGFFFDKEEISHSTEKSYIRQYLLLGTVGDEVSPGLFELKLKNRLTTASTIEFIGPDTLAVEVDDFTLYDEEGVEIEVANHHQRIFLKTDKSIAKNFIIRQKTPF